MQTYSRCNQTTFQLVSLFIGTPKIYTTTGFGPRKNRERPGVDDLVVYMQTAVKYSSLYIHHHGGINRPRGSVYRKSRVVFWGSLHINQEMVYTSHVPFFLGPNAVVVYISGVPMENIFSLYLPTC